MQLLQNKESDNLAKDAHDILLSTKRRILSQAW
jgi:hypothetical protein